MLEKKISYILEMTSHAELMPPVRETAVFELARVEIPCPEFNWFLHQAVGANYLWGGRDNWGYPEWSAFVNQPELETWVAYQKGAPMGYYELIKQADGSVQIDCFGLLKQFIGQGVGGALLVAATERCWEMGANRVWLTTCSHDHEHALKNYLARGYKIVKETVGAPHQPRDSVLFTAGKLAA